MTFTCTQQAVKYVRGAGPSAGEALDLETHRRPGSSRPPALVFETGGMVATLGQQAELIGPPDYGAAAVSWISRICCGTLVPGSESA